jgi:dolichol-phosphate mannosyltransferase
MNTYHNFRICVAIPTINEKRNLEILLPVLRETLPTCVILVIDDGSTDGTDLYLNDICKKDLKIQVVYRGERLGIGSAHMLAMEFSKIQQFDYLITMDGDLTHSPNDVEKMLARINERDLIIGSRYFDSGGIVGWSLYKYILTRGGHFATKLFFRCDLDMSSGLRAYRVSKIPLESVKSNCPHHYDFFLISTLVFLSEGLNVGQIGATLSGRASGKSKMNLKLVFRGMTTLIKYGLKLKKIQH